MLVIRAQPLTSAVFQLAEDGADKDIQDVRHQLGVIGQPVTELERERQHPLTDRDPGKDPVHQMRRRLRNPASSAARTPRPSAARKRDDAVMPAHIAMDTDKAMFGG